MVFSIVAAQCMSSCHPTPTSSKVLLKAWIKVGDQDHHLTIIIDSGANSEFMDEKLAKNLEH